MAIFGQKWPEIVKNSPNKTLRFFLYKRHYRVHCRAGFHLFCTMSALLNYPFHDNKLKSGCTFVKNGPYWLKIVKIEY